MTAMTTRPEYAAWAGVVPDDDPPDMAALARLQVLNTLILAGALHRCGYIGKLAVIRYETAVLHPAAARAELARLVPEVPGFTMSHGPAISAAAEDTFATSAHKTELTACLTAADAEEIGAAVAGALSAGREAVPGPAWDLARDWASGDCLYTLTPPDPASRPRARRVPAVTGRSCPVRWVVGRAGSDLRWRSLLVTNDEFAAFLNEMADQRLPNCLDGSYLLAVEMPHERGGRLHYNPHARRWIVSPGFGTHPAYWVTWTGAAAFAARHGARLPTRAEMIAETSREDLTVTNHGYRRRHSPGDRAGPRPRRDPSPGRQPTGLVLRRPWRRSRRPGGPLAAWGSVEHAGHAGGDTPAARPSPSGRVARRRDQTRPRPRRPTVPHDARGGRRQPEYMGPEPRRPGPPLARPRRGPGWGTGRATGRSPTSAPCRSRHRGTRP